MWHGQFDAENAQIGILIQKFFNHVSRPPSQPCRDEKHPSLKILSKNINEIEFAWANDSLKTGMTTLKTEN